MFARMSEPDRGTAFAPRSLSWTFCSLKPVGLPTEYVSAGLEELGLHEAEQEAEEMEQKFDEEPGFDFDLEWPGIEERVGGDEVSSIYSRGTFGVFSFLPFSLLCLNLPIAGLTGTEVSEPEIARARKRRISEMSDFEVEIARAVSCDQLSAQKFCASLCLNASCMARHGFRPATRAMPRQLQAARRSSE